MGPQATLDQDAKSPSLPSPPTPSPLPSYQDGKYKVCTVHTDSRQRALRDCTDRRTSDVGNVLGPSARTDPTRQKSLSMRAVIKAESVETVETAHHSLREKMAVFHRSSEPWAVKSVEE